MTLVLETRSYPGNKVRYSELGPDLKWLVDAIVAEDADAAYYLNHGENRDPTNAWGRPVTGADVLNYYQPVTNTEYKNGGALKSDPNMSGRRRLLMRKEGGKVSFFTCSHPVAGKGGYNNGYGAPSWICMQE